MTSKYAILMETSIKERESWYYFIQYDGNEKELKNLRNQLELVENVSSGDEDTNFFDLDIANLVSEACVDEMLMVELNSVSYHRKFYGVLDPIDFEFEDDDDDTEKLEKINEYLEDGGIESFIEHEFIPDEHALDDETDEGLIDSSKLPKSLRDFKV